MKMGTISCSEGRDYSKSAPVRYIPKKSSGNKESEVSSSLPKSHSDVNGKRVELSRREQNSFSSRSFVVGKKFEKEHENPVGEINYNNESGRVAQSNVERIQLSRSSQTSGICRSSDIDNEFQNGTGKPFNNVSNNVGVGTGSLVQPHARRTEPTVQASDSSWSSLVCREYGEKLMNNINNDIGWSTSGVVQPDIERIESPKSAQTSCSSRTGVVEPQFHNLNESPTNNAKCESELGTSSNVESDLPRIELSESVHTSCSDRSFMADAEYQNQNKKPIEKVKCDVGSGTSRVPQSNVQKIGHSNNEQTSCSGRSFVLTTEELGIGEEFDGDMHFEDYEFTEELEGHSEEKSHEGHGMQGVKIKDDVQKLAVELLAVRALTALELRKKLQGKNFPLHVVDAVIRDFKAMGLINDGLYAETFSRSRWSSSTWGPRRIKKALYTKGVSDVDAEKAVKLVFNDTSASGDQESDLGMSKLSMDHLFAQAAKQWSRSSDVSVEKRKSRIIRWLQYRGFGWSIISIVLKKLSKSPT